jgi:hypothetical protein
MKSLLFISKWSVFSESHMTGAIFAVSESGSCQDNCKEQLDIQLQTLKTTPLCHKVLLCSWALLSWECVIKPTSFKFMQVVNHVSIHRLAMKVRNASLHSLHIMIPQYTISQKSLNLSRNSYLQSSRLSWVHFKLYNTLPIRTRLTVISIDKIFLIKLLKSFHSPSQPSLHVKILSCFSS